MIAPDIAESVAGLTGWARRGMSNTLAGLPFALVCVGILVYAVILLLGTLAIERRARREEPEEYRRPL